MTMLALRKYRLIPPTAMSAATAFKIAFTTAVRTVADAWAGVDDDPFGEDARIWNMRLEVMRRPTCVWARLGMRPAHLDAPDFEAVAA